MRSLVFGGTGMLGRAVVAEGRRRGWAALGLSRAQGDVTDPEATLYWAETFRPQVIVNCAAFTRVDECESRPEHAFEVNGHAVGHVAAAAATIGARLVQISTDYVFSGQALEPYPEAAKLAPTSVYGASKKLGEDKAGAYGRALILRVSWLFGAGGPNFVATMLRLIAQGQRPLRVVEDQIGGPTYTAYAARAICDLAVHPEGLGIVHYQNREPVSWYDFAREIVRQWDPAVPVEPLSSEAYARPARRPAFSVLDVGHFERMLGRRVEPWSAGLAHYLAEIRRGRES